MKITTRRHVLFYIGLTFSTLFFIGVGTLVTYFNFDNLTSGHSLTTKEQLTPVLGIVFLAMGFYTLFSYYKNAPLISLDSKEISFGTEVYQLKDIEEILLTGKVPFKYIINFPMEGMYFRFKNGKQKFFYDEMYSNSWLLKSFLEQVVIKKEEYKEISSERIDSNAIRYEKIEEFKGNQFLSLQGILLWGAIGFFIFLLFFGPQKQPQIEVATVFGAMSLFFFLLQSYMMHYFGLTKDYFIVYNHNFIWKQKIFRLNDIKEIVFESRPRMPYSLRIITKDFKNKLYPAGTLRDKTWLELKERFEQLGIEVRNECIYEKNKNVA